MKPCNKKKEPRQIADARQELNSYAFDEALCKELFAESNCDRLEGTKRRMKAIETKIDLLPQPYKCILHMQYVRKKSFLDISIRINYCKKQVSRYAKKGVELYSKINKKQ